MNYLATAKRTASVRITPQTSPGITRQRLMLRTSALAAAVTLGGVVADSASAQQVAPREDGTRAVQANGTFVQGSGTVTTSPISDTVTVDTDQTIINWTTLDQLSTNDTADYVNYLPAGTEMLFIGPTADYVVLNRVFTAQGSDLSFRGVAFGGTVNSRVGNVEGATGGNIWFYSPGGILAGNGAAFNVGSLLMTTSNIDSIDNGGASVTFRDNTQSGSSIIIDNTAAINTLANGSYVALFAPRVEARGTITTGGGALIAAGEEGTLNINGGMFDLEVTLGTEDANGIVHTGTTQGTEGAGAGGSELRFVAVPKNDALTMLMRGSVGYTQAAAATVSEGRIVLSAGSENAGAVGNVAVRGDFLADTFIEATGNVQVTADGAGDITTIGDGLVGSDLTIDAENGINIIATRGGTLEIDGDLRMFSQNGDGASNIFVLADDPGGPGPSTINVSGSFIADASGSGANNDGTGETGGDGTGGGFALSVTDGSALNIGGDLTVNTSGRAGRGAVASGDATAGNIDIFVENSTVDVSGTVTLSAQGLAAAPAFPLDGTTGTDFPNFNQAASPIGGDSTGGSIRVVAENGSADFGGLTANASATASSGTDDAQAQSNDADAGLVSFVMTGSSLDVVSNFSLLAQSTSGTSFDGAGNRIAGQTAPGNAVVTLNNSQLTFTNGLIDTRTYGEQQNAPGTTATVSLSNVSSLNSAVFDVRTSHHNGASTAAGVSGAINLLADNSTLGATSLLLDSRATMGIAATEWAPLTGGDITLTARNNGTITGSTLTADAGVFNDEILDGAANIIGGRVLVQAQSGAIDLPGGTTTLRSTVNGPSGGADNAFFAQGGFVDLELNGTNASMSFGDLTLDAQAQATNARTIEDGFVGEGGDAVGGAVSIVVDEGVFTATDLSLLVNAFGGRGGAQIANTGDVAGDGGDATGGFTTIFARAGTFNTNSLTMNSSATGGRGGAGNPVAGASAGGDGGSAGNGRTILDVSGGDFTTGEVDLRSTALGGNGGAGGGSGGDAEGGRIDFTASGGTFTADFTDLTVVAQSGEGRDATPFEDIQRGGNSGNATGGVIDAQLLGGAVTVERLTLSGSAVATRAGDGLNSGGGSTGDARAGTLSFLQDGADFVVNGVGSPGLSLQSNAVVLEAGDGSGGQSAGDSGDAVGGTVNYSQLAGDSQVDSIFLGGSVQVLSAGNSTDNSAAGGVGGDAIGSDVNVVLAEDIISEGNITMGGFVIGGAGGNGNNGGAGGAATGGNLNFAIQNANVGFRDLQFTTTAIGGAGGNSDPNDGMGSTGGSGGAGGAGNAGDITLSTTVAGSSMTSTDALQFLADGTGGAGGDGADGSSDVAGGAGGFGRGGTISITAADETSINLLVEGANPDELVANGIGGAGGDGGDGAVTGDQGGAGGAGGGAMGGTISIAAGAESTVAIGLTDNPRLLIGATATAGLGGDGGLSADGVRVAPGVNGSLQGGTVAISSTGEQSLVSAGGSLVIDTSVEGLLDMRANSSGGSNFNGGNIAVNVMNGGQFEVDGGLALLADARAGAGELQAGIGRGGDITLSMSGAASSIDLLGTFTNDGPFIPDENSLYADASAYEPQSVAAGVSSATGGATQGGNIALTLNDGSSNFAGETLLTVGSGTDSPADTGTAADSDFANGAAAFGGSIVVNLTDSTHAWGGDFAANVTTSAIAGRAVIGTVAATLDNAQVVMQPGSTFALLSQTTGETELANSALPNVADFRMLNGSELTTQSVGATAQSQNGISNAVPVTAGDASILLDNSTLNTVIGAAAQSLAFFTTLGETGVSAIAGDASFTAINGSNFTGFANIVSSASADAGPSGGDATTGSVSYLLNDSQHQNVGAQRAIQLVTTANSRGGSDPAGTGGVATTGAINMTVSGASALIGDVFVIRSASSQYGFNTGGGIGDVVIGDANITLIGGTVDTPEFNVLTQQSISQAIVDAAAGALPASGANATSGDVAFNFADTDIDIGSLAITNSVTAGAAEEGNGALSPVGGSAMSGAVTISHADGGTGSVSLGDVSIENTATGGEGGDGFIGFNNVAGAGGAADSGAISLSGTLDFTSLAASNAAIGGDGGVGGFGESGSPGGDGGAGGAAASGGIALAIDGAFATAGSIDLNSSALGGAGGNGEEGGSGGDGAAGGAATAGLVDLDFTAAGDILTGSTGFTLNAAATGGAGGNGGFGDGGAPGAAGDGGNATAAGANLTVSGTNASLTLSTETTDITVAATGGRGGNGGLAFFGLQGVSGGIGGDATSGAVIVTAENGGTVVLDDTGGLFALDSLALGGAGGTGSDAQSGNSADVGTGGNGGSATAGGVSLVTSGGTFLGAPQLRSRATGGAGGDSGGNGDGLTNLGIQGDGGDGQGGRAVLDNAAGPGVSVMALGDTSLSSIGVGGVGATDGQSIAGFADVNSTIVTAGNALSFGSLALTTEGDDAFFINSVGINVRGAPLDVAGDFTVNSARDTSLTTQQGASVQVGGTSTIVAGNDIRFLAIPNDENFIDFQSAGDFNASAANRFRMGIDDTIATDGSINIDATIVQARGLRAADSINIDALVSIDIQDGATITGPVRTSQTEEGVAVANGVRFTAGRDAETGEFAPGAQIRIFGDISSSGNVSMTAGGTVTVSNTSSVSSDNGITIITGDDIIIQDGGALIAGIIPLNAPDAGNPFADDERVNLQAGLLGNVGLLSGPGLTPIASIVAPGIIDANGLAITMSANAVDGRGGTITASSLRADINDAPAAGAPRSDDNGLLTAPCLEGSICLGTVTANNRFEIGQNSNQGANNFSAEGGDFDANAVLITTNEDIVLGQNGLPDSFTAQEEFALESRFGNVDLGNASVTSGRIAITAAESLLGNGSLTSVNDIGITVGQDLNAALIDTGGQLTTVATVGGAAEASYFLSGDFRVGRLVQGIAPLTIFSDSDIDIDEIALAIAGDVRLVAGGGGEGDGDGDLTLGSTTNVNDLLASGDNVTFTDLDVASDATLTAFSGDVTGGNIDAGGVVDINADGGDIGNVTAGGLVSIDSVSGSPREFTAGNITSEGVQISGGRVRLGTVDAGMGDVTSVTQQRFIFDDITAGGDFSATSANDNIVGGNIDVGGTVAIDAQQTDIQDIFAGGSVDIILTDRSEARNVTAGGAVTIETGGTAGFDDIIGTSVEVAGDNVRLGDVEATVAGIAVDSSGSVNIDSASAVGNVEITSALASTIGDITAADATLTAGGAITGGDLTATGAALLDGALVDVGAVDADSIAVTSGSDILFASLDAVAALSVDAENGSIAGNAGEDSGDVTSDGQVELVAQTIDLDTVQAGGALTATSTVGGTAIDIANAGGDLTISAATDADIGAVDGGNKVSVMGETVALGSGIVGGALVLNASAGDVNFAGDLAVTNDADIDAIGNVTGGNLTVGGTAQLDGASIAIGDGTAGTFAINSGSDILFDTLTSANAITLNAAAGTIGANPAANGAGDITSGSDVTLDAQAIALGDVSSGGSLSADASVGDASFGQVDATNNITVTAAGQAAVANATSGGNTSLTGATVSLPIADVGGDLALNATAGDLDATGGLAVAGGIDLDAAGDITFGSLGGGGDFTADAGDDITFDNANSVGGTVDLTAGGAIAGGFVATQFAEGAGDVNLVAGGSLAVSGVDADGNIALAGASLATGDLTAMPGSITATTDGTATLGELNSGLATSITANGITLAGATSGLQLTLDAGTGNLNATGNLSTDQSAVLTTDGAASIISVSAAEAISANVGSLDAGNLAAGTTITVLSDGATMLERIESQGDASVTGAFINLESGSTGGDLTLATTAGDLNVADDVLVVGAIDLDSVAAINFGELQAGGDLTANAGTTVSFAVTEAEGDIRFAADAAIIGGDTGAGRSVTFTADTVDIGSVNSGETISITADQGIIYGRLNAQNGPVALVADNGAIIARDMGSGIAASIDATGDVTLTGQSIAAGDIRGGAVAATASTGDATFGLIDAAGDIGINAAGAAVAQSVSTPGTANITGASVELDNGDVGDLVLNATASDLAVTDTVEVANSIDLDAAGAITFGTLSAQTGNFTADAGGDITFDDAQANTNLTFESDGQIVGGDILAGNSVALQGEGIAIGNLLTTSADITTNTGVVFDNITTLDELDLNAGGGAISGNTGPGNIDSGGDVNLLAQSIDLGNVRSGSSIDADATQGALAIDALTADVNIAVDATGSADIGSVTSGGDTSITGSGVTVSGGAVTGDLTANATAGTLSLMNLAPAGGAINLSAVGDIAFDTLAATGGDFEANALEGGAITFGTATASGNVEFNTDGGITGGDATAGTTLALTGGNIEIGAGSGDLITLDSDTNILFSSLTSPNAISLTATDGFVRDRDGGEGVDSGSDVAVTAQIIDLGDVTSGGDLTANATAGDATFAAVDAAGAITIMASGAADVASATSGDDASVTGATVSLDSGTVGGALALDANAGNLVVNNAVDVAQGIALEASGDVIFGDLAAGGDFTVAAGNAIGFGSASSTGEIDFDATEAINGGDVAAGGALTLDGGSIAIGAGSGETIDITSENDVSFASLASPAAVMVNANGGTISGRGEPGGDVDSGGDVTLAAQSLTVGNVTSDGSVSATASTGDAAFGAVEAAQNITITAAGTPSLTSATSGNSTTINGASVALDNGTIGGDLTLNAIAGDVTSDGEVTVGGGIDLDATGDITFADLAAQGGDFTADVGGNIAFANASASGSVDFGAAGNLTATGDIAAGDDVALDANGVVDASGGAINAGGAVSVFGLGGASFGTIDATQTVSVVSTGNIAGGSANGGGTVTLDGADVVVTALTSTGGDVVAGASSGSVTVTDVNAASDAVLFSDGVVTADNVTAGQDVVINGGGAALGMVTADGDLRAFIDGPGGFVADSVTVADMATVTSDGGPIAIGAALDAGGDIALSSASAIAVEETRSGGSTALNGAAVSVGSGQSGTTFSATANGGNITTGAIDSDGALTLNSVGSVSTGDITSDAGITVGAGVDASIASANSAGSLAITAGEALTTGDLTAVGELEFIANTADVGALVSSGASIDGSAAGDLTFGTANAAQNVSLIAGQVLTGGNVTAGRQITLGGSNVAVGTSDGSSTTINSDSDILFDEIVSPDGITLIANDNVIAASGGPGDIDSGGDVTLSARTITIGDVTSGGSLDATATAGDATFGAVVAAENITVTATGTPSLASAISGGDTMLSGASVTLTTGDIGGDLALTASAGDVDATGDVVVAGAIALTASETVRFGSLSAEGGDLTVVAGEDVVFEDGIATGAIVITSGDAVTGGALASGTDLTIEAGAIALTSAQAVGDVDLTATTSDIAAGQAIAGENLQATATGNLMLGEVAAQNITLTAQNGTLAITGDLSGDANAVLLGDDVTVTDGNGFSAALVRADNGSVSITAVDDVIIADTISVGDVALTSTGGSVLTGTVVAGASVRQPRGGTPSNGQSIFELTGNETGAIAIQAALDASGALDATGDISVSAGRDIALQQSAAGGSIILGSGGDTLIESGVSAAIDIAASSSGAFDILGDEASLEAGGALDIASLDRFQTTGLASGQTIAITSGDVIIGEGGQLGDATATSVVTLQNQGAAVTLGGDGDADGYVVDAAEFGRIASGGDLTVNAVGSTSDGALVTIDDLSVNENGTNIGGEGAFTVSSQGDVDVLGALDLTGAGEGNTLALSSGGNIRVVSEAGNLRIEDADGNLIGTLVLEASGIAAGSEVALGDIEGSSTEALDERLGEPGAARDNGFFQADNLEFTVGDYLLIQNSGASSETPDRRGFTANSVTIRSANEDGSEGSGGTARFVINGTIGEESGIDAARSTQTEGDFDGFSSVNGCFVVDPSNCIPVVTAQPPVTNPGSPVVTDPVQNIIEEEIREDEDEAALDADVVESMLIILNETETGDDTTLINDPVTGAGNDDLWNTFEEEDCDLAEDGSCSAGDSENDLEPAE